MNSPSSSAAPAARKRPPSWRAVSSNASRRLTSSAASASPLVAVPAFRWRRETGPQAKSSSRTPTSRCTGPRPMGGEPGGSSSPTWTPVCRPAARSNSICAKRWRTSSSRCSINRSTICGQTASTASRRCCAGSIPVRAWSLRTISSRSPKRSA